VDPNHRPLVLRCKSNTSLRVVTGIGWWPLRMWVKFELTWWSDRAGGIVFPHIFFTNLLINKSIAYFNSILTYNSWWIILWQAIIIAHIKVELSILSADLWWKIIKTIFKTHVFFEKKTRIKKNQDEKKTGLIGIFKISGFWQTQVCRYWYYEFRLNSDFRKSLPCQENISVNDKF
jgi:hypothetical protein